MHILRARILQRFARLLIPDLQPPPCALGSGFWALRRRLKAGERGKPGGMLRVAKKTTRGAR
eukprot:3839028-Rhodomonas_salina.1